MSINNLPVRHKIEMTEDIRIFLKESYLKLTYKEIAKIVPYSSTKIRHWLLEMGLEKVPVKTRNPLPYTPSDLEFILLIVSKHSDVTVDEIRGEIKKRNITLVRQLYCYLAFKYTNNSTDNIGKHIGGRDHTTVGFAIRTVKDMIDTDYEVLTSLLNYCDIELSGIYNPVNRERAARRTMVSEKAA